ncbi:magnesium chelatase subunit D family protein [Nocardioides flavescens]|uniref:VWA domain-containing protein n=1 Tax=Nocardioides flavescens TaxID=2691959 RepID=A0A6L7F4Q7_9ACTN|nr:magnesium chelatase subunit D family protein [Nocardioides flavescens]MXG92213.1 VWA domain-containing protein [Nocardioides flavescens]
MPAIYPFSAVVDPGDMSLALVLTSISPEIGGVLVRGEKGTAKSTIVRGLAAVLPPLAPDEPVRLVELPVGATEDRVLGSLHLEKVLAHGQAEYEPGLLVKAHRGILYVDEVNLLHDHLVDVLLDAAAMGRVTVERDGVSVTRDARFVLVGTMNPEEGELRPQLLDRFGLTVEVAAPRDPAMRVEVVRRRMGFDADPAGFAAAYAGSEEALTARITAAQAAVGSVELGDAMLLKVAEVCAAFDVDGLRADIVTARTAVAHAAWHGRTTVTLEDVRVAARLALPHRRRRNPFDAPGLDEALLDEVLGDDEPEPDPGGGGGKDEAGVEQTAGQQAEGDDPVVEEVAQQPFRNHSGGSTESTDSGFETGASAPSSTNGSDSGFETGASAPSSTSGGQALTSEQTSTASAGTPYRARLFTVTGTGTGEAGRRSRAVTATGRRVGSRPGTQGALDLVETVRAAAPHQVTRGRVDGRLHLQTADLRVAVREGRESNLVLFCVDASGSMAARKRMEQVKTAILSLLMDAYQRRDKVGLVTFRADRADLALPPTHSVDAAARRLQELPAGGRTPLAEGLLEASRVLELERVRDPRRRPLLVVVTDGRATAGADPVVRSRQAAALLAHAGIASVLVDCEAGPFRLGLGAVLAEHLGAEHVPVGQVDATALAGAVRTRVA